MEPKSRHQGYDNIRGILIILVVFGHFLELSPGAVTGSPAYLLIYSFHMPAMLFLSGLFSKYDPRHMRKLLFLYLLFQFLYRIFAHSALGISGALSPNAFLMTPYWLLWYLPVLLYCQTLLPLWASLRTESRLLLLCLSIVAAMICGYFPQIGYPFSLSRFIVFLPFFLAGKLTGECKLKFTTGSIPLLLCAVVILSFYLCRSGRFNAYILYGSYPYAIGYSAGIRLQAMTIAAVWIYLLLSLGQTVLNKPIPLLSYLGAHTLPVYLLHGFAVKYIASILPDFSFHAALISSAAVIALTGNPVVGAVFNRCLHIKK